MRPFSDPVRVTGREMRVLKRLSLYIYAIMILYSLQHFRALQLHIRTITAMTTM